MLLKRSTSLLSNGNNIVTAIKKLCHIGTSFTHCSCITASKVPATNQGLLMGTIVGIDSEATGDRHSYAGLDHAFVLNTGPNVQ